MPAGNQVEQVTSPDFIRLIALMPMANGLIAVVFALLSKKSATSQGSMALKHLVADGLQLYLDKNLQGRRAPNSTRAQDPPHARVRLR